MKKPAIIFIVLSVYIVSAFTWWTYAHIKRTKQLFETEVNRLDILPYKATLDIREAVDNEMFVDSNDLIAYFNLNYPELSVTFSDQYDPLNNYMIQPKPAAANALENKFKRQVWMYALEGIVMVLLIFWGIIWIYRSLQNRLNLKRQQSNFLLSITHELKTPLASIRLYLETLLKRQNLDKEVAEKMMRNSLQDVDRLKILVENLLLAAQLDSHQFSLTFTKVNLSDLIAECTDKFVLPRNLNHRLVQHIELNLYVNGDKIALEMVLINLISNAFKYSPPDQPVHISASKASNKISIKVSDHGQGISAQDKKNLFDMFYRAEDENIRKSKGTGLGLYIVKNLLALHKANIEVYNNNPTGAVFEVTINNHA